MLKKIIAVLMVTLLAVILVVMKVYPEFVHTLMSKESDQIPGETIKVSGDQENVKQDSKDTQHRDRYKSETFPFQDKKEKELAKKYPDQFQIVKKMYYSWDYIDNAQGEFEWGDPDGGGFRLQFNVDFNQVKNRSQSQRINDDGKVIETTNVLLKNKVVIRQRPKENIYTKESLEDNPSDIYGYLERFHGFITNSEWYGLLRDTYPNWNYKVGEKFGIPVYQIEGEIPRWKSHDLAGPFTMIVSKDTGVLLELKANDYFVTVKEIQINQGIPNDLFQLDVSGDKKVSNLEFNLSSVGGSVGGDKPGGVDTSGD